MKYYRIIVPFALLLSACSDTGSQSTPVETVAAVETVHVREESFPEPFRDLIDVEALGDSAILVADIDRLYLMSLPEQRVLKMAGQGDGIGEFRQIGWIQTMRPDTIAVFDSRHARITLLSPGLEVQRTIPLADIIGDSVVRPYCMLANGHALIGTSARPSRASVGEVRSLSTLSEFAFDGTPPRTLASLTESVLWVDAITQNGYRMSMATDVPFASVTTVRCDGSHAFWLDGTNPHLRSSDSTLEIALNLPVDLVSATDRAAAVDSVRARLGDGMADLVKAAIREVPVDTMPHFKDLLPGAGRKLWLLSYRSGSGFKTWSEVDHTGSVLRTVAVPIAFDVTFATESSFWGIWTDTTGLRSVKRYTFD